MSYNFDQEQPEAFEFVMGGHRYSFRYPTLDEIREMTSVKGTDGEPDIEALNDRIMGYVKSLDEGAPTIDVPVGKLKGRSLKAWRKMIREEVLAIEG